MMFRIHLVDNMQESIYEICKLAPASPTRPSAATITKRGASMGRIKNLTLFLICILFSGIFIGTTSKPAAALDYTFDFTTTAISPVSESDGSLSFNVTLDQPVAVGDDVAFSIDLSGTATVTDGDLSPLASDVVQIPVGMDNVSFTVTLVDDQIAEPYEYFIVEVTPNSSSSSLTTLGDIQIGIDIEAELGIVITEESACGTVQPPGEGVLSLGIFAQEFATDTPSLDIYTLAPCTDGDTRARHISDIIFDDISVSGVAGADLTSYVFTPSPPLYRHDHSLEVYFSSVIDVAITGPGSVEHDGQTISNLSAGTTSGDISIEANQEAIFTITPNTGYNILSVLYNGNELGSTSPITLTADQTREDGTLEIIFGLNQLVVEPISRYGTIYTDAVKTIKASTVSVGSGSDYTLFVDMTDQDYRVRTVVINNLPITIPANGGSTSGTGWSAFMESSGSYLEVSFTNITVSHRLEAIDYDTGPILDTPLAASTVAAPANLMLLFDDSGSMDWSVMTPNGSEGKYFIGSSSYENVFYGPDQIPAASRMEWKSQWHEYNRLYYNPSVEYVPWPRVVQLSNELSSPWDSRSQANADTERPRIHPLDNSNLLYLHNEFTRLESGTPGSEIIIDDGPSGVVDGFGACYSGVITNYGSGYNNDWRELLGPRRSCGPPYARWQPSIPDDGEEYEIYVQWQGESDSYRRVCYEVFHANGSDEICSFDHRSDSPGWVSLGTYTLDQGNSSTKVEVSRTLDNNNSGKEFSADAVLFSKVDVTPDVVIPYAHYYIWSETEDKPFLVIFDNDNGELDYYEVDGTSIDNLVNNSNDMVTALTLRNDPPADVVHPDDYDTALQNFANWVTYYHERRLAAIAATSRALVLMEGVQIGLSAINSSSKQLPLQKVKVDDIDETETILKMLYTMPASGGTPLRRALEDVGEYYNLFDGSIAHSRIGNSSSECPWYPIDKGGECQQSFVVLMTDGFWNSDGANNYYVERADNDNTTPVENSRPLYAHPDVDTLADIAMYFYENDLVPDRPATGTCTAPLCLDDKVNPSPENTLTNDDPADWQHMVTFAVSFGLVGTIDQDYYMEPYQTGSTMIRMNVDNPNREFPNWPWVSANSLQTVDDMFHAGVNGRGGFHNASNPDELVRAMVEIVSNISERTGSAASVSVNGDELFETIGSQTRMFQSEYNTDSWWGDLTSYSLNLATGDLNATPIWSASDKMDDLLSDTARGYNSRKIFTYKYETSADGSHPGAGVPFDWANLSTIQQEQLTPYFATSRSGEDVLTYLKGDSTWEPDGTFRDRIYPLGDFVHSQAVYHQYGSATDDGALYIGSNDGRLYAFRADDSNGGEELFSFIPSYSFKHLRDLADPFYDHKYFVDATPAVEEVFDADFSSSTRQTLLVGALGKGGKGIYALDVTNPESFNTANILWEYPRQGGVITSGTNFSFVDNGDGYRDEISGPANVFASVSAGEFITIIGADCSSAPTGSNSKSFEVLAVTDSNGTIEVAEGSLLDTCGNGQQVYVLKSPDPDMGYSYGTPSVVLSNALTLNSGTIHQSWVVIIPNGYGSDNGSAVLSVLDPTDGTVLAKIDTQSGPDNGLSPIRAIDVNNDLRVDYVYGGDLYGNMWKFDLTSSNIADWQVAFCNESSPSGDCNGGGATPQPLFSANFSQPITGAPDVMRHEESPGYMVIFGTGKYMSLDDLQDKSIQSLYGIWDWAPDKYDQGYLGRRVDNTSVSPPIVSITNSPLTTTSGDPINTLLRQVTWVEGVITEDTDGDGIIDDGEDVNGNGVLDTFSYYRIPSNYQGDWDMVEVNADINDDGTIDNSLDANSTWNPGEKDVKPAGNVGWVYDLPGKILGGSAVYNDGIDNDGDGSIDEAGERALGERVTSDAIIRDGKAILISFGPTLSICEGGAYSFVNERDAQNGGMTAQPVFDLNGDGEVDATDMVMISVDVDGDGTPEMIPGIPTDKSFKGHIYNPAILREPGGDRPAEEIKYFSITTPDGAEIETVREAGERRGIFYWQQVE